MKRIIVMTTQIEMFKTKAYTVKDFYMSYLSFITDNELYQVDYKTYRQIVTDYFKHIYQKIVEESNEFKLPCRLGTLCIVKHKPKHYNSKSLRVDFKATNEYNKTIFHLNEHSDGYKFRFYWNKKESLVTNKSKYQLIATRFNKRRLAQIIKNKEHDYITI